MNEPTNDPLRAALRSWDPATRVDDETTRVVHDQVRGEIQRNTSRRFGRARALRRYLAAAAVIGILLATVALLKDSSFLTRVPGSGDALEPVQRSAQRMQSHLAAPQQLTLVASNGVRVYWTIPGSTPAEAGSGRTDSERRN